MRIDLHPEARLELRSAAVWYDERLDGLGEDFVAAVTATLQRISDSPSSFPYWVAKRSHALVVRKAMVEGFPYSIAFEQHEEFVLVLAVAHERRRPLYWLPRASRGADFQR